MAEKLLHGDGGVSLPHDHGHISRELMCEIQQAHAFEDVADIFKMMSDGMRVQIFLLLCHCEECVINISALTGASSPAVSHHLRLLKDAGLVISRREGREVYYTAVKTPRAQILHETVEGLMESACPSAAETFRANSSYDSQIQMASSVHDLLTSDLRKRYTIEELSARFLINQTTLKTVFKRVYGLPIASYMKEFRIKRAMEYLSSGEMSVAEVAAAVGYENQSKFTEAFKAVAGVLPREYKRR